jgi:hypothetical protein
MSSGPGDSRRGRKGGADLVEHPAKFAGFPPAMSGAMLRPRLRAARQRVRAVEIQPSSPAYSSRPGKVQRRYREFH